MEIILKYGSKARGDSDSFSDSDILIVGDIPKDIRFQNLDVARYTKNRLEKLKEKKSLFLLHLREESVILRDQNGWMDRFLRSIPNYTPDDDILKLAHRNLSTIVSLVPCPAVLPCWFDMVFVFLRDLLVKLNAINEHYVFAPEMLVEKIDIENKEKVKKILNISREIKTIYRNHVNQNIFINPFEVSEVLIESFELNCTNISCSETIKNPNEFEPYLLLRLVEYGMRSGLLLSIDKKIEQFIKNPHRYSWEIKQEKWIDNILMVEHDHSPDQLQLAASAGR